MEDKKEVWRKSIGEGERKGLIEITLNARTEQLCSAENSFRLEFYPVHNIKGYIMKQGHRVLLLETEVLEEIHIDMTSEIFEKRISEIIATVEIFNPMVARLKKRGYENGLIKG